MSEFTYGSLCTGLGGLDLGIELACAARSRWQCEPDPFCRAILAERFGVPIYENIADVDERAPATDLICAGWPCQGNSDAGLRRGLDDPRSGLWHEVARVLRVRRPALFIGENVAGLLVPGRGFERVVGDLAACGYDACWATLRACDVGAPHRRRRVFLLAYTDIRAVRQFAERIQQHAAECWDAVARDRREELANASGHAADDSARHEVGSDARGRSVDVAHATGERQQRSDGPRRHGEARPQAGERASDVADAVGDGRRSRRGQVAELGQQPRQPAPEPDDGREAVADADDHRREGFGPPHHDDQRHAHGHDADRCRALVQHRWPPGPGGQDWLGCDGPQPGVRRGAHGAALGLDDPKLGEGLRRVALASLGNAVVPQQAAQALVGLTQIALRS